MGIYASAFLELDFGMEVQTWNDENDTYINNSKTTDNLSAHLFFLFSQSTVITGHNLLYSFNASITNIIHEAPLIISSDDKIFIKDKTLLI